MYSSEDFERLFIRYKSEAYPKGGEHPDVLSQEQCSYSLVEKWYKPISHCAVKVKTLETSLYTNL